MNRSPARVVELCIYAMIIIAAIIWMVVGGKLYKAPDIPTTIIQTETRSESAPPSAIVPKGEIFQED